MFPIRAAHEARCASRSIRGARPDPRAVAAQCSASWPPIDHPHTITRGALAAAIASTIASSARRPARRGSSTPCTRKFAASSAASSTHTLARMPQPCSSTTSGPVPATADLHQEFFSTWRKRVHQARHIFASNARPTAKCAGARCRAERWAAGWPGRARRARPARADTRSASALPPTIRGWIAVGDGHQFPAHAVQRLSCSCSIRRRERLAPPVFVAGMISRLASSAWASSGGVAVV